MECKEIKLTELEINTLKRAKDLGMKYIVRNKDDSLLTLRYKPFKDEKSGKWVFQSKMGNDFNSFVIITCYDILTFISWINNEPYKIEELLKGA